MSRQITEVRMHNMREGLSSLQEELEKARQGIQLAERILARDAATFDEPACSLPN